MGNSYCKKQPEVPVDRCDADIMDVSTTGADKTAQVNNHVPGIDASQALAAANLKKVNQQRDLILLVAQKWRIQPAVIAALISRDTNEDMTTGSKGQRLAECIEGISLKFPNWTKEQQLKGGIAAYNAGTRNVHAFEYVDEYTTNGDYANDVVARAKWYRTRGGF